jgi:ribosomal-protein-alanine N-acetyltransferase
MICNAKETDLGVIEQINLKCLPENYPDYWYKYFYNYCGDYLFTVTEKDKIVGYIIGVVFNRMGYIVSLAILPKYRRRGYAKKLITILHNRLSINCDICLLHVNVTNNQAIDLYEQSDYTIRHEILNYYDNNDNGLIMLHEFGKLNSELDMDKLIGILDQYLNELCTQCYYNQDDN